MRAVQTKIVLLMIFLAAALWLLLLKPRCAQLTPVIEGLESLLHPGSNGHGAVRSGVRTAVNSMSLEEWGFRDVTYNEPWPEIQYRSNLPGSAPLTVHYMWCGNKKFRFSDYLGVLSAIRLFQPLKLVFHFTHHPKTDSYNTWFKELESSVAGLEKHELKPKPACGSRDLLEAAMGFLSEDGGVYLSDNIVLSRAPDDLPQSTTFWFAVSQNTANQTPAVIFAKKGFDETLEKKYIEQITSKQSSQPACVSVTDFNKLRRGKYCITMEDIIYPRDITEAGTSFAELARWLFYGKRAPAVPEKAANNLIPRITHYIRFKSNAGNMYKEEFTFNHFLNVLSAIYVAGFQRVYMHVEEEPTGRWWQELAKENVTVVKVVRPNTVYQQPIKVVQHISDVARYLLLYKFGGAYQDFDVTWTSRVPDSLLSYPFVAGMEWMQRTDWPEAFNFGVFLTRPGSQFLSHFIQTHYDFRDEDWGYNSLLMSYRTYELYPHLVYPDRKLQVLCFCGICHPAWEKNYVRPLNDKQPTISFKWQEVRCIHVTCPKPHPSLASPEAVRKNKDMYAEIGRFVLEKSGRKNLVS